MRAVELMTIDDVFNAIGLTAVLFYFLIPTIVVILSIYAYNRHKKNKEIQKKLKTNNEAKFEKGRKILENNNESEAISAMGKLEARPKEMNKFNSLAISFDETGHAK